MKIFQDPLAIPLENLADSDQTVTRVVMGATLARKQNASEPDISDISPKRRRLNTRKMNIVFKVFNEYVL